MWLTETTHTYLDIHDIYFHINAAKDQIIKVDHNIWNVDTAIQLAKAWDNFPAIPKAPPLFLSYDVYRLMDFYMAH